jgi:hypothetical protein
MKNHPVVNSILFFSIGLLVSLPIMLWGSKHLGFEFEKKGTYLYYNDFNLEIVNNYIPKLQFDNIMQENNNLRVTLDRYRTRESNIILDEIMRLENELKIKSSEYIQYTSGMRINFDGSTVQRNLDTEKARLLSEDINSIQKRIDSMYEKL